MKAPHLCHPLVLEEPQHVSDGAGGFIQGWAVVGTLWAEVIARTGRGAVQSGIPTSRVSYKITVRGAPFGNPERPKPQQRFRDGARVFNIQAVAERDHECRYLTCFADEEVVA